MRYIIKLSYIFINKRGLAVGFIISINFKLVMRVSKENIFILRTEKSFFIAYFCYVTMFQNGNGKNILRSQKKVENDW